MSGIVGIYDLDDRPASVPVLRRMMDALAHRGPDGSGQAVNGPVGLGQRMLHTTPEALDEVNPYCDGDLFITMDGRVDNREELLASLSRAGAVFRAHTDVEIMLRAYQCWGESCPRSILGDYAFAIWDARRQELFCARDFIGARPLYYFRSNRFFVFSSEPQALFEHPGVLREPNEGMVGEYLAVALRSHEETLSRGVFRLPPAHSLIVAKGVFRKSRYWEIDPSLQVVHRSDGAYAEHFRATFDAAVRCRVRHCRRVGAELSGGLDSSSVVGAVQALEASGEISVPGFETFSLVFPNDPACDESQYIEDVVRKWSLVSNRASPSSPALAEYFAQARRYRDFPGHPNGNMANELLALARQKGFRVLLTGCGGDDWLDGSPNGYRDLLRPLLPRAALRVVQRLRRSRRAVVPPWITPAFAKRIGLTERLHAERPIPRFESVSQRDVRASLMSAWQSDAQEASDRQAAWFGVEHRDPFHDRRVVELAAALPNEQRWRQGQRKFIMREALRDALPASVLERRTKAEFSSVLADVLRSTECRALFASPLVASLGWVDGARLRAAHEEFLSCITRRDRSYQRLVWPLWMTLGVELCYRSYWETGTTG